MRAWKDWALWQLIRGFIWGFPPEPPPTQPPPTRTAWLRRQSVGGRHWWVHSNGQTRLLIPRSELSAVKKPLRRAAAVRFCRAEPGDGAFLFQVHGASHILVYAKGGAQGSPHKVFVGNASPFKGDTWWKVEYMEYEDPRWPKLRQGAP